MGTWPWIFYEHDVLSAPGSSSSHVGLLHLLADEMMTVMKKMKVMATIHIAGRDREDQGARLRGL
jgi:hypothetical protein